MNERRPADLLATEIDALVAAARDVAGDGLVEASSGNLSIRRDDLIAITGGGVRLDQAARETCVVTDLNGEVVSGSVRPSSETQLHALVYEATGCQAIVHTHSHFAVVLSTLVTEVPVVHYAMASFGGPVRVAPYSRFGSTELAHAVAAALSDRKGALMANHGAVTIGSTIDQAVELAYRLEWLSSIAYHTLAAGGGACLPPEELDAVREKATKLRYREPPSDNFLTVFPAYRMSRYPHPGCSGPADRSTARDPDVDAGRGDPPDRRGHCRRDRR